MPQGVEKATKSPDSYDYDLWVLCGSAVRSEDAGCLPGLFESGERLIDLCGRMFGRDGHTDSAGLRGNGRGADRRSEDSIGQQMFRKDYGFIGATDENRYDRAGAGRQSEAGSHESVEESVAVLPQAPASFRLPLEYVQRRNHRSG